MSDGGAPLGATRAPGMVASGAPACARPATASLPEPCLTVRITGGPRRAGRHAGLGQSRSRAVARHREVSGARHCGRNRAAADAGLSFGRRKRTGSGRAKLRVALRVGRTGTRRISSTTRPTEEPAPVAVPTSKNGRRSCGRPDGRVARSDQDRGDRYDRDRTHDKDARVEKPGPIDLKVPHSIHVHDPPHG